MVYAAACDIDIARWESIRAGHVGERYLKHRTGHQGEILCAWGSWCFVPCCAAAASSRTVILPMKLPYRVVCLTIFDQNRMQAMRKRVRSFEEPACLFALVESALKIIRANIVFDSCASE